MNEQAIQKMKEETRMQEIRREIRVSRIMCMKLRQILYRIYTGCSKNGALTVH
jgi:hypothetical protein